MQTNYRLGNDRVIDIGDVVDETLAASRRDDFDFAVIPAHGTGDAVRVYVNDAGYVTLEVYNDRAYRPDPVRYNLTADQARQAIGTLRIHDGYLRITHPPATSYELSVPFDVAGRSGLAAALAKVAWWANTRATHRRYQPAVDALRSALRFDVQVGIEYVGACDVVAVSWPDGRYVWADDDLNTRDGELCAEAYLYSATIDEGQSGIPILTWYAGTEPLPMNDDAIVQGLVEACIRIDGRPAVTCDGCDNWIAEREGYYSPNDDKANGIRFCLVCTNREPSHPGGSYSTGVPAFVSVDEDGIVTVAVALEELDDPDESERDEISVVTLEAVKQAVQAGSVDLEVAR